MIKYIQNIPNTPRAVGPYSPAVQSGGFVYLSGQLGLDPASGKLVEGGVAAQTEQVLSNVKTVLEHLGLGFGDIVKTTIFLLNMAEFQTVNGIYERWMGAARPARSTLAVAALPLGGAVEIEVVARSRSE